MADRGGRSTTISVSAAVDRRRALLLLALLASFFLVFCFLYVPRLNNNVMSDREFTGWTGPIAERLVAGERPYVDFVLPIPPGSFALLALVQYVAGRAVLLQELWTAALLQLGMALLGYAVIAPLTSRRTAALAAICTLVTLLQLPKECIYDHTAQICAWGSLALGTRALLAADRRRRAACWGLTGLVAVLTMAFKQSTATGIVLGWILAFAYLVAVRARRDGREAVLDCLRDARGWAAGAAVGLSLVVLLVLAVGSTLGAYFQAIFLDAPELKGGSGAIASTLATHVLHRSTFSGSLFAVALALLLGFRIARRHRELCAVNDPGGLDLRTTVLGGIAIAIGFGVAIALLGLEVRALPRWLWSSMQRLGEVPGLGLVLLVAFFVGHLRAAERAATVGSKIDAFNAVAIAAVCSSLLHDASFEQFGFFYNNNPIIVLAFASVLLAARQSGIPGLTWLVVALALAPIAGRKTNRALSADTPVGPIGHWAGMRVNYRGVEILKAARRVRALTGPRETVLVLPEDVQLVGLIDRPRPPLRGAVVFVDQYPTRLVEDDLRAIDEHPPRVIVIHPRKERDWRRLFATWNDHSGAAKVLEHVLLDVLPGRYRLDSTYPTVHFWDQGQLDVYVRIDERPAP